MKKVNRNNDLITIQAERQEWINLWGYLLSKLSTEETPYKRIPVTTKSIKELEHILFEE